MNYLCASRDCKSMSILLLVSLTTIFWKCNAFLIQAILCSSLLSIKDNREVRRPIWLRLLIRTGELPLYIRDMALGKLSAKFGMKVRQYSSTG